MPTPTTTSDRRQLELPADATVWAPSHAPLRPGGFDARVDVGPKGRPAVGEGIRRRDRITVDLRGLRSRLDAEAARRGTTAAAVVRRAVVLMLDEGGPACQVDGASAASSDKMAKVTLRMSASHALALARRARAADVAQGRYVCSLLDGQPVPPLPADHAAAVAALRTSTDQVAAMCADLNAFLRLLGQLPADQLAPYRTRLRTLAGDMRAHLATASALIADLTLARRSR